MQPFSYIPISCDFYDVLEECSILRQNCEIVYFAEDHTHTDNESIHSISGIIADLYARNGEEFMILRDASGNNIQIRLDKLVFVNGINARVQYACDIQEVSRELALRKLYGKTQEH